MTNSKLKKLRLDQNNSMLFIFEQVVIPCVFGSLAFDSDRPTIELVNALMCAKEINYLLENDYLRLLIGKKPSFEDHKSGKELIKVWANRNGLDFDEEVDISVGVADVLVYGEDLGIFEVGMTKPSKILLLLRYIAQFSKLATVHFWPYGTKYSFSFKNWFKLI